MDNEPDPKSAKNEQGGMSMLQVVGSVVAAAFGVQSRRNRERDFAKGNVLTFIAAGLLFTALFVGAIYAVVQLVLPDTPPR